MRFFFRKAFSTLGWLFSKYIKFLAKIYTKEVDLQIVEQHEYINEVVRNVHNIGVYIKKHPKKNVFQLVAELKSLFGYSEITANFIACYKVELEYEEGYTEPKIVKFMLAFTIITNRLNREKINFTERVVSFCIHSGVNVLKNTGKL